MSASLPVSVEQIQAALRNARPWEKERLYKLLEQRQRIAPPVLTSISAEDKVKLKTDFSFFCQQAWRVMKPGTPLYWSWHYDYVAEYLMMVRMRRLRRLIINVPPRTSKSTWYTVCFPTWTWVDDPLHNFLTGSYSKDLSTEHSIYRRNLIQSQWYQGLFGDVYQLSPDRNLTTQFSNDKGGQMIATSTGSGAEGRGGDTIILDDPMSNLIAMSDLERKAANDWVSTTLKQRLNDPAHSAIIVIMQRLHEMDTTGYLLSSEPGQWTHISIPLVEEKDRDYVYPISGKVVHRKKGDVLQPDRFPPEVVKEKQGKRLVYAGQYQQRPAPLEGNMIKRKEVRYYGGVDPLTNQPDESLPQWGFDKVFISVDCSFKDLDEKRAKAEGKEESDFVAIGAIGVKGRKRYILDIVNEHLDINGTEIVIKAKKIQWNAQAVIVEDKANGPAVCQRLRLSITGVIEINPQGGKIARVYAVAPEWQAGDWYVDRNAAWCEPFIQQITMFPTAAFDDMTDMMSQAGIWLQGGVNLDVWAALAS